MKKVVLSVMAVEKMKVFLETIVEESNLVLKVLQTSIYQGIDERLLEMVREKGVIILKV